MVDGVNNPRPATQHSTLKIKGTDQKIDLNNLAGLQKTKGNESIFKMYDKDNNGIIDQKEAYAMRNNLQSLAGNGTISKREINKLFGKDSNALDQLSTLTNQQTARAQGKEYVETNGNTSTHIDEKGVMSEVTVAENGIKTKVNADGSREFLYPDGSKQTIGTDGTVTSYNKNGEKTEIIKDGKTTKFTPDGKSVTYNDSNGNNITKEYDGAGDDAKLTSITVSEQKDGQNIDTKYATEEDMQNNRPSERITNADNPETKTVTKYTYDEYGNVKAEETNSKGETNTTYTDAGGNEIGEDQFGKEKPQSQESNSYNVERGDNLWKIAKNQLGEGATATQIANYVNDIMKENPNLKWDNSHTNVMIHPGDTLKLPTKEELEAKPSEVKPNEDTDLQEQAAEVVKKAQEGGQFLDSDIMQKKNDDGPYYA